MRPTSPLSPRYDTQSRFESLQPPSPRNMHSRAGNGQRRANTNSLKLPSLPRFHPANYPSAHSSLQVTPDSGFSSPQPPMSPRTHQRMYSDAQKQLYFLQRESIVAAARSASPVMMEKPDSPRLAPMGSPGPVTPLELETEAGYLVAGVHSATRGGISPNEIVEGFIQEEATRRRNSPMSSRQTPR
ncbi:hypothetical protein K431DRAFT_214630 [Polychaeton citri CBS 116435]|uniref:Uncharacterized protein n=1 Tax=Polychaeton citri CBS 116435 TaxID=1314669 RepID=A0A9P4UV64_9PEZI|nr:hypothetical protein K431DRAFT_214630 [Polychaeton citri CBS 116435]